MDASIVKLIKQKDTPYAHDKQGSGYLGKRIESFEPDHIFVYEKIKHDDLVSSILANFPTARVDVVPNQSPATIRKLEPKLECTQSTNKNAAIIDIAKKLLFIGTATRERFVEKFTNKLDCLCPQFYSLTPLNNGCYYSCAYCYLQVTYRGVFPYIKINVNLDDLKEAVLRVVQRESRVGNSALTFNCGEKLDSLSFDRWLGLSKILVPFFANTSQLERSTLLLLTKSDCVENLIELASRNTKVTRNTVVSWSLNSEEFAIKYEIGSPPPSKRLGAARKCQDAGYKVRLRIDPLLFLPNWHIYYERLVKDIFLKYELNPEIITLGALRFETGLDSIAKARFKGIDLFDYDFIVEGHDKHRYKIEDRIILYKSLISMIEKYSSHAGLPRAHIGLCKEKRGAWLDSGLNLEDCHCNCIGHWQINRRDK